MSYTGPEFAAPPPRRSRRRGVVVAVGVLVPGALLGWLGYEAVGGADRSVVSARSHSSSPSAEAPAAGTAAGTGNGTRPGDGKADGSLRGKVIVIDPGHNPRNFEHPVEINRLVDIGTNTKECDTTGTATDAGYAEARFTLDVAHRMRALLEARGATVRLTQDGDRPYGPCVDERARIGNEAHADAVVSVHADGSAAGNRGFHVIVPGRVHKGAADTRAIVAPSRDLGERIVVDFARATGSEPSDYLGGGTGITTRTDLGGLNLSTVPKVFVECGNMRDSADAALLTSGAWRQKAAKGISEGIVSFLHE